MTKFFIPPVDSQWKLLAPWQISIPLLIRYGNEAFVAGIGIRSSIRDWEQLAGGNADGIGSGWVPEYRRWEQEQVALGDANALAPIGTLIQINRMQFSQSDHRASVQFLGSDNPYLTPKKAGGKGKGKLIVMLTVAEINQLPEMEQVS